MVFLHSCFDVESVTLISLSAETSKEFSFTFFLLLRVLCIETEEQAT